MEQKGKDGTNRRISRARACKKLAGDCGDFEDGTERRKRKRKSKGERPPKNSWRDNTATEPLAWTDKYKPSHEVPFVGNVEAVRELRSWLSEWKTSPADRRTTQSSDSEASVEAGLSNCMLLYGPTGSGKTSCVYYTARELGYKVIEVNASSERPGKKILTQLQEATQSHHVEGCKSLQSFQCLSAGPDETVKEKKTLTDRTKARKATSVAKRPRNKPQMVADGPLARYFTPKVKEGVEEGICIVEEIKKESPKATLLDYFGGGARKEPPEAKPENVSAKNAKSKKVCAKDVVAKKAPASSATGKSTLHCLNGRVEKKHEKEAQSESASARNGIKKKAKPKVDVKEVEAVDVIVIEDSAKGKKVATPTKTDVEKMDAVQGRKRKTKTETQEKPSEDGPGLTYSSLTLILFDDVDVVFEQDDGFWNAVETVLQITKKPVIFTASRDIDRVRSKLPGHCPTVELARPSAAEAGRFLRDVLMVEDASEIKTVDFLSQHYHCDLRRCLSQLQFETAAGRSLRKGVSRCPFPTNVGNDELREILKRCQTSELIELQAEFGDSGMNLAYSTLHDVLPLPGVEMEAKRTIFYEEYCPEEKASDSVFDASWLADTSTEGDDIQDSETKEQQKTKKEATEHTPVVSALLGELSNLFDAFSTADVIRGGSWKATKSCPSLQPFERTYAYCEGRAFCGDEALDGRWLETPACLEALSLKTVTGRMARHFSDFEGVPELCLALVETVPRLSNMEETSRRERSLERNVVRAAKGASQGTYGATSTTLPDYASALHQICFFEGKRRLGNSNRSRRFLHYLSSCNIFLSSEVTDSLCNRWLSA